MERNENGQLKSRTLCMECHYLITYGKPLPVDVGSWGHNLSDRGIEK
jgi:hypothetical protein